MRRPEHRGEVRGRHVRGWRDVVSRPISAVDRTGDGGGRIERGVPHFCHCAWCNHAGGAVATATTTAAITAAIYEQPCIKAIVTIAVAAAAAPTVATTIDDNTNTTTIHRWGLREQSSYAYSESQWLEYR